MGFILIEHGPQRGKIFPLSQDELSIGRGIKNDIVLSDNEVSASHCRLVRVLDDYEIHDLHSTNGTFVNERRVEQGGFMLTNGNRIQIGDCILLYLSGDSASNVRSVAPTIPTIGFLVVKRKNDEKPMIYQLDRTEFSIGRDTTLGVNDIVLTEAEVSRTHLRVVKDEKGVAVEDMRSTNGTKLNGNRLLPAERIYLSFGDHLVLGETIDIWYTNDTTQWGSKVRTTAKLTTSEKTSPTRPAPLRTETISAQEMSLLSAPPRDNDVLIVYQREDWDALALPLARYLWSQGIRAWSDQLFTPNTPEWRDALEQAKRECRALLVIASPRGVANNIQSLANFFSVRNKSVYILKVGEVKQLPMTMEKLPQVSYDAKNPVHSFMAVARMVRRATGLLRPSTGMLRPLP